MMEEFEFQNLLLEIMDNPERTHLGRQLKKILTWKVKIYLLGVTEDQVSKGILVLKDIDGHLEASICISRHLNAFTIWTWEKINMVPPDAKATFQSNLAVYGDKGIDSKENHNQPNFLSLQFAHTIIY